MYSAIVFLPIIAAIIAGLFGRVIGARASEFVTTGALFISAALSCYAFYDVIYLGHAQIAHVLEWVASGGFEADWTIRVDALTAVMLVVVTGVSSLVHLYSIGYMHEDDSRPRFFAYLSFFTFAMLALVTSNNFLQLFFGWEGVGLASYLLIGFWYTRPSANAAAIKAFVVNRVGDFGFALGIFGIYAIFHTLDFDAVFAAAPAMAGKTFLFAGYSVDILTTLCLLLFVGAMGKSAQIVLHTWLPDAMEGPTPVSALIHAATMVTAGVFLVCRCSPLFELAPNALAFVTFIGATTAFFAASVGLFQNDIKRVIAYSTCSQLGYMFVAAGVSAYGAAMFHLFTHAFFKALLFLGAGSVIHAMHHEQDMRKMGGLAKMLPFTWAMMGIGNLALTGVGIPYLIGTSGFYSKDGIINATFLSGTPVGTYAFVLTLTAALMTSFYSWRQFLMTFHGPYRGAQKQTVTHADADGHSHDEPDAHDDHGQAVNLSDVHESPLTMLLPLLVLALGALFAGMIFNHDFVGPNALGFWHGTVASFAGHHAAGAELPAWVEWAPFFATIIGFGIAYYYYVMYPEKPPQLAARNGFVYRFLYNKWYFDELYDVLLVRPTFRLARFLWKFGDGRIIDGLGPDGIAARVLDTSREAVRFQTGYVYHYAFAMLAGVVALTSWFIFERRHTVSHLPLLTIINFLPSVGALLILGTFGDEQTRARNARAIALLFTLANLAVAIVIWRQFDGTTPAFQFVENHSWLDTGITYHLGVDGISMLFLVLTAGLMPICIIASWKSVENRVPEYMIAFLLLETMMMGVFTSLNLILFYIFFEAGLIPMFLIIGVWGGKRRVYASFKFFLYTLLGSVLMLLAILAMYLYAHTTDIEDIIRTVHFPVAMQTFLFFAFFASFAVKMPMWPFHTWLPDAHVEAPTAGSVLLAAVLLKMGGYGFLRFSLPMFPAASVEFAPLIFALSVIAIVYTSLVALAQEDMKKLIAYSSVAHMGFVTMGIFSLTKTGVDGGIFQMLSHGVVSGALFLCVGVVYDRIHTREIDAYGGLVARMPVYAVCFMVFSLANVGLPGTSGFVGEFLTMLGTFEVNNLVVILAALGVILSAAYMLYLYRRIIFGALVKPALMTIKDLSAREILTLAPLVAITIAIGVYPKPIFDVTSVSVANLVEQSKQAAMTPVPPSRGAVIAREIAR